MDWTEGERDEFTFQGDVYDGRVRETDLVTRRAAPPDDTVKVRDTGANNASIFVDRAKGTVDLERARGSKRRR